MKDATEKLRELCDNINGDFEEYPSAYGSFKSIVGSECTIKLRGSNKILELGLHNEGGKTDFYLDVFKGFGFGGLNADDRIIELEIKDIKDLEIK
jgi:hypothetical protein